MIKGEGWSSLIKVSHYSTFTALITGMTVFIWNSDDLLMNITVRMINVGSLTGIITTLVEKNIGFGVAFLMPLILIVLAMIIFVASSKVFGKLYSRASALCCCSLCSIHCTLWKLMSSPTLVKHGPSKGNLARTMAYVVAQLRARLKHPKASNAVDGFQEPTHDAKFSRDMSNTWKACRIL